MCGQMFLDNVLSCASFIGIDDVLWVYVEVYMKYLRWLIRLYKTVETLFGISLLEYQADVMTIFLSHNSNECLQ